MDSTGRSRSRSTPTTGGAIGAWGAGQRGDLRRLGVGCLGLGRLGLGRLGLGFLDLGRLGLGGGGEV